jgi:hypothetical protein
VLGRLSRSKLEFRASKYILSSGLSVILIVRCTLPEPTSSFATVFPSPGQREEAVPVTYPDLTQIFKTFSKSFETILVSLKTEASK